MLACCNNSKCMCYVKLTKGYEAVTKKYQPNFAAVAYAPQVKVIDVNQSTSDSCGDS